MQWRKLAKKNDFTSLALFCYVQWTFFDRRGGRVNLSQRDREDRSPGAPTKAVWTGTAAEARRLQLLRGKYCPKGGGGPATQGQWLLLCSQNHEGGTSADKGDAPRGQKNTQTGRFPEKVYLNLKTRDASKTTEGPEGFSLKAPKFGPQSRRLASTLWPLYVAFTTNTGSVSRLWCSVFSLPL